MPRLLSKPLLITSLLLFTLSTLAILAGKTLRPSPALTWTTSNHTQHSLYPLAGLGPTLLSIHDPSNLNLPLDRSTPATSTTDHELLSHSYRRGLCRSHSRFTGKNNSTLTSTTLGLPYLYLWLATFGATLPTLSLLRRLTQWTLATWRDPDRRSRALFRAGATLATLLLLTAAALTTATLTDTLEISFGHNDYRLSLHSRSRGRIQSQFTYPTGPWLDPSDLLAQPTAPIQPTRLSFLGCTFQSDMTMTAMIKPEHYNAAMITHAAADAIRHVRRLDVTTPFWLPLPFLLAYPLWFLLITRRRRTLSLRRQSNQCLHCGYDLRSSPTRCPECGTATHAA